MGVGFGGFVSDLRVGLLWLGVVVLVVLGVLGGVVWWLAGVVSGEGVGSLVGVSVDGGFVVDVGSVGDAFLVSGGDVGLDVGFVGDAGAVGVSGVGAVVGGGGSFVVGELVGGSVGVDLLSSVVVFGDVAVRGLLVERDGLLGEVGRLSGELLVLGELGVGLAAEVDALRLERDALLVEREGWLVERGELLRLSLVPPPPLPVVDSLPLPSPSLPSLVGLSVGLGDYLLDLVFKLVDDRFAGVLLGGSSLGVLFVGDGELLAQGLVGGSFRVTERLWGNDFGDVVTGAVVLVDGVGWEHERVVVSVLSRAFGEPEALSASELVWRSGPKVFSVSRDAGVLGRVVLRVVDDGGAGGSLSIFDLR
jgi:hypothetical protein